MKKADQIISSSELKQVNISEEILLKRHHHILNHSMNPPSLSSAKYKAKKSVFRSRATRGCGRNGNGGGDRINYGGEVLFSRSMNFLNAADE